MECPECSSEIREDSRFCRVCGKRIHDLDRTGQDHARAALRAGSDLTVGSVFLSRYRIIEELGRGGMGVVLKAEDTKLRRNVALKFLPPELTRDTHAKQRFLHEARAASALDHPGICIVHEIDETGDGQIFISMGCYEGETLKDKVERGPLDVGEAVDLAIQIAEGLADAHEKGIVHRDVKPSNIMVTTKGQAKIMDFGLAKLAGQTRITKAGTTMGTIAYMSPEQARGEDIDHRTDIWSLGVMLYELLTGKQPFRGEYDQAVIYSILNEDHRPLSEVDRDIPAEIETIVDRCLQKRPEDRFQSAGELAAALRRTAYGAQAFEPGGSRVFAGPPGTLLRRGLLKLGVPLAAVVAVVVLVSITPVGRGLLERIGKDNPVTGIPMKVAVLPCAIVGGSAADTAFCAGMAKTLTERLALLERFNPDLQVLTAGDVLDLREKSPLEARRILGANVVLTGTLDRSPDAVRLRPVRIDFDVDAETGSETDAFMERRGALISDPIANLSTWQDSVVADAAALLGLDIGPEAGELVFAHGTSVPEAYVLYLEGQGYLNPYEGGRRLDEAIRAFGMAVESDSSYVSAYIGLATAYYRAAYRSGEPGLYEKAIEACDRALERDEDCAAAHVAAGYTHYMADELDDAVVRFRRAIEMDSLGFDAYFGMGYAMYYAKDFEGAEAALWRAAELRPHVTAVYELLTYIYLAYQGEYRQAVRTASKTVELRPNTSKGYVELGAAQYSLGNMDEATEAFEKSLGIDSTYLACANLGTIYFGRTRYADAARMYKAALRLGSGNYRMIGLLAEAYYWSPGQRETGKETFRQAIAALEEGGGLDYEDPVELSDLASYCARVGQNARSESLLVTASSLEPTEVLILFRIADTYEQLGKRRLALEWLERALEKGAPLETMDDFPGLRELRTDSRYRELIEGRELDL